MIIKKRILKLIKNQVPDYYLQIGGYLEFRIYNTESRCVGVCYKEGSFDCSYEESGFGYDRSLCVFNYLFEHFDIRPKDYLDGIGINSLNRYHIGGNLYRIPKQYLKPWRTK